MNREIDRPAYFWDAEVTRADVERLLAGEDCVERRWVVRRLLEYAPREEALRLLGRKEIESGAEDPALTPLARRTWRAYLDWLGASR